MAIAAVADFGAIDTQRSRRPPPSRRTTSTPDRMALNVPTTSPPATALADRRINAVWR
jgi:hypothetical protein